MEIEAKANIDTLIMVGDRVLIKPKKTSLRTKTGLYLPPGVKEKEAIHSGYVIKVGSGYPIPSIADFEEPWKSTNENVKYIALQPREGDLAVFLQKSAWEIQFQAEKYLIVPHAAILMLLRDNDLYE